VKRTVTLGDKSETRSCGEVSASLRIQGFKARMNLVVLEALPDGLDVILGDPWFDRHSGMLDWERSCCIVRQGKRSHVLTALPTTS
jgi:hypothetical protein